MFGTIVLAVDGSAHSERAVELARKLAAASGDQVFVTHVTEYMVGRSAGTLDVEGDQEGIAQARQYAKDLADAGIAAQVELARVPAGAGHIAKAVLEVADKHDAGLILMGSHGRTDLTSLLLGSVAHKVLHLSHRPVLIAR
jgi:nucleotide-binding universal stress UspA family protein